jgi:hypothetical protein
MKTKPAPTTDELRMKAADFDRIMRGVLEVAPPPEAKKPRAKTSKTKKSAKK